MLKMLRTVTTRVQTDSLGLAEDAFVRMKHTVWWNEVYIKNKQTNKNGTTFFMAAYGNVIVW